MAAPLTSSSRAPSRTRLLAERALSPFFAPESADSSTDPSAQPRRLVRRDSAFHQSSGKINMHRGLRADRLLGLAKRDWYHVLLSMKSRSLLLVIACTFTLVVVFYAFMFMLADHSLEGCGIAPRGQRASFYNAFAFALETLTTIGYAVPYDKGDFFNSCPGMLLLIYSGSITYILVNALIVGLIIGRLARASSRANQVRDRVRVRVRFKTPTLTLALTLTLTLNQILP